MSDLKTFADSIGLTIAQVAISWLLSRSSKMVAIIGFRELKHLKEDIGYRILSLDEMVELGRIVER